MNKDLIDQLPADEKTVAEKLSSAAETMKLSQSFQWNLETRLMDAYQSQKENTGPGWSMKFLAPAGWTIAAVVGVLVISWMMRTLLPGIQPAAGPTVTQEVSFVDNVRAGNICMSPLALGHGFDVFLTNPDKTKFVALDPGNEIGELRSFTWSADGQRLAVVGNTTGRGNIYITDPTGGPLEYVLYGSELGYLLDAAWSRDGKQLVIWSSQNLKMVYLLRVDGNGVVEKQLDARVLSTPQFSPDGKSIVFYGADPTAGLFEAIVEGSQIELISAMVEDETGYAFSPDGTRLAYMEMDRTSGEARLISQELATGNKAVLGTLPIPKGSGSSIPESANLSWSADSTALVFDLGREPSERAIYLAPTDGTGLIKVVDSAYAPSISSDGKCLAYISNKQVFLLDLTRVSSDKIPATSMFLADLPDGRGAADFKLDKLQWKP